MVGEFSLKCLYSTKCGKIFKFIGFIFLENALIRGIFVHVLPHLKLSPTFLSSRRIGKRKLLISPDRIFWKTWFRQQQKGVEETVIYFVKIEPENIKMTRNIRPCIFFMTSNFFKCDGFTVFKIVSIIYHGINFIGFL